MTENQSAAFFDFDGTLIRGDSQSIEFRYIIDHEMPSFIYFFKLVAPALTGCLAGLGLLSHELHNRSYVKTYRGESRQRLMERGQRLYKYKLRHAFFPLAMDLMKEHRRKGRKIVLVSATPYHILEPVADDLKPDAIMCTELEYDTNQQCTGYPLGRICMGSSKAEHIGKFAIDHSMNLNECYAYSDHHADLPFLEATGHPEVINPTPRLFHIARERKWPVHRCL